MVDVEFVGQLVGSMEDAVLKLEKAVADDNKVEANKLRTFVFDLHKQIEGALVENVRSNI
jgi:hypothetical protein